MPSPSIGNRDVNENASVTPPQDIRTSVQPDGYLEFKPDGGSGHNIPPKDLRISVQPNGYLEFKPQHQQTESTYTSLNLTNHQLEHTYLDPQSQDLGRRRNDNISKPPPPQDFRISEQPNGYIELKPQTGGASTALMTNQQIKHTYFDPKSQDLGRHNLGNEDLKSIKHVKKITSPSLTNHQLRHTNFDPKSHEDLGRRNEDFKSKPANPKICTSDYANMNGPQAQKSKTSTDDNPSYYSTISENTGNKSGSIGTTDVGTTSKAIGENLLYASPYDTAVTPATYVNVTDGTQRDSSIDNLYYSVVKDAETPRKV